MREKLKNLVNWIAPNHFDLISKLISQELEKLPSEPITVLDIGGGAGEYWLKEGNLNKFLKKGQIKVTIIDAQIPNPKDFSELDFKQGFAPKSLSQFSDSHFDMVIASDLIEHLSKEDGYILLYEMERLANKICFIFTPNGFVYQRPEPNNPFNAHISGWTKETLKRFGWKDLRGHSGFRVFFGVYGLRRFQSKIKVVNYLWIACLLLSQIIVFRVPSLSYALSATYRKKEYTSVDLSRINLTDGKS